MNQPLHDGEGVYVIILVVCCFTFGWMLRKMVDEIRQDLHDEPRDRKESKK